MSISENSDYNENLGNKICESAHLPMAETWTYARKDDGYGKLLPFSYPSQRAHNWVSEGETSTDEMDLRDEAGLRERLLKWQQRDPEDFALVMLVLNDNKNELPPDLLLDRILQIAFETYQLV